MDTPSDPRLGTLINGTYRLDKVIGIGGMGVVYGASDEKRGRKVALKILHPHVAELRVPLSRFRREAQIASQLGHEGIVQVLDFANTDDGAPFLVMELLAGETLTARLTRGHLSLPETWALFERLCAAIHAVHEAGVVHRDLKPDNIFLNSAPPPAPPVKVLDFGISKVTEQRYLGLGSFSDLTGHDVLGTPSYLAPEQAAGSAAEADRRADVFALGTILYECLTGQRAFAGATPIQVLRMVLEAEVPKVVDRLPGLPPQIDAVIGKACAKDPRGRYDTVRAFSQALQAAIAPASNPISESVTEVIPENLAGPSAPSLWTDGETLVDTQVEALRAAVRQAQNETPTPTLIGQPAAPPQLVAIAGRRARPDEPTENEATVRSGPTEDEGTLLGRVIPEDRATALLETVPIPPPEGFPGSQRWAPTSDPTVDVPVVQNLPSVKVLPFREAASASPTPGWGAFLTTAVLAVIVGVVVGMLVLKFTGKRAEPSLVLEDAQRIGQEIQKAKDLAKQGRCKEALAKGNELRKSESGNPRLLQELSDIDKTCSGAKAQ